MIFTDDCFLKFSEQLKVPEGGVLVRMCHRQLECPSCYMVCNDRFLIGLLTGSAPLGSRTNLGHHGFTVDQKG